MGAKGIGGWGPTCSRPFGKSHCRKIGAAVGRGQETGWEQPPPPCQRGTGASTKLAGLPVELCGRWSGAGQRPPARWPGCTCHGAGLCRRCRGPHSRGFPAPAPCPTLWVNPHPCSHRAEPGRRGLLTSGSPRGFASWQVWPLALGAACQALAHPLQRAAPLGRDVHCKPAGGAFPREERGQALYFSTEVCAQRARDRLAARELCVPAVAPAGSGTQRSRDSQGTGHRLRSHSARGCCNVTCCPWCQCSIQKVPSLLQGLGLGSEPGCCQHATVPGLACVSTRAESGQRSQARGAHSGRQGSGWLPPSPGREHPACSPRAPGGACGAQSLLSPQGTQGPLQSCAEPCPRAQLLPKVPSPRCSEPNWLPGGRATALGASPAHPSVALGRPSACQRGRMPTMPPGTPRPALGICSPVPGPGRGAGAGLPPPSPSVPPAQPDAAGMGSGGCGIPQPSSWGCGSKGPRAGMG